MARKTSISKATTLEEIGEYWDTHSVTDIWDQVKEVDFEIEFDDKTEKFEIELNKHNSKKVRKLAKKNKTTEKRIIESLLSLLLKKVDIS